MAQSTIRRPSHNNLVHSAYRGHIKRARHFRTAAEITKPLTLEVQLQELQRGLVLDGTEPLDPSVFPTSIGSFTATVDLDITQGVTVPTLKDVINGLESLGHFANVGWSDANEKGGGRIGDYLYSLDYSGVTYESNGEYDAIVDPTRWDGEHWLYYTNNELTDPLKLTNGVPTIFNDYTPFLLTNYSAFDAEGEPRLNKLVLSFEEIEEYTF